MHDLIPERQVRTMSHLQISVQVFAARTGNNDSTSSVTQRDRALACSRMRSGQQN